MIFSSKPPDPRLKEFVEEAIVEIPSAHAAYRLLEPTPPQSIDNSRPPESVTRAANALCAIVHYLYWSPDHAHTTAEVDSKLPTIIWPWISYLLDHFVFGQEPSTQMGFELQDKILWAVPMIMYYPSQYRHWPQARLKIRIRKIIDTTPEMVPTAFRAWLYCFGKEHPALELHSTTFKMFEWVSDSSVLQKSVVHVCSSIRNPMRDLLHFAGYEATQRDSGRMDTLHLVLFVISLLSEDGGEDAVFFHSFILHGGIHTSASVIESLSSPKHFFKLDFRNRDLWITWLQCIRSSLKCVTTAFKGRSYMTMIQALNARLLCSMVNSTPILELDRKEFRSASLSNLYRTLLVLIAPFLLYDRVWNLFMRSFKQITSRRGSYSAFLNSHSLKGLGEVTYEWNYVISCLASVKKVRQEYRAMVVPMCANKDCPGESKQLQKCSRCSKVLYCSKACQRHDWEKNNHRKECDSTFDWMKQTGLPPNVTASDRRFFSWLSKREIHNNNQYLKEQFEGIVDPVVFLDLLGGLPVKDVEVYPSVECPDQLEQKCGAPMPGVVEDISGFFENGSRFVVCMTLGETILVYGFDYLCTGNHKFGKVDECARLEDEREELDKKKKLHNEVVMKMIEEMQSNLPPGLEGMTIGVDMEYRGQRNNVDMPLGDLVGFLNGFRQQQPGPMDHRDQSINTDEMQFERLTNYIERRGAS
ncbi:hypothetical protein VKT23_004821 [Stygiomarasmius scandens]|uniref:MYND-type domain-containing protein n=1 Tax=Marasmiellus scandens TaxID=2682957 RepID=A0ABR1JUM3_9AGAR